MSTQMVEPSVDLFVEAWSQLNNDPHESVSLTQATVAVEMVADVDGEEMVKEARSTGVLDYTGSGYTVAGARPPEDDSKPSVQDKGSQPEPEEMERSELEQEVRDLRTEMDEMSGLMKAMNARLDNLTQALVGSENLVDVVDPDNMTDVWTRLNQVSEDVGDHEDKLHMFSKGGGKKKKPDERALTLRQVLFQKAKGGNSKVAKMTRDECDTALGGGMSRYILIDAMRRAANGEDADIDGSSDLENLNGVEIIIAKGRDDQSKIRMDLNDTTSSQLRRIPTTERERNGGD